VIVLITVSILTLNAGTRLGFLTNYALMPKPFFLNVFDSPNVNGTVLFLKVAFWNPYCTNIMNPDIMAGRLIQGVGFLIKIVIIELLLLFLLIRRN
jgi:hypothetical protein